MFGKSLFLVHRWHLPAVSSPGEKNKGSLWDSLKNGRVPSLGDPLPWPIITTKGLYYKDYHTGVPAGIWGSINIQPMNADFQFPVVIRQNWSRPLPHHRLLCQVWIQPSLMLKRLPSPLCGLASTVPEMMFWDQLCFSFPTLLLLSVMSFMAALLSFSSS